MLANQHFSIYLCYGFPLLILYVGSMKSKILHIIGFVFLLFVGLYANAGELTGTDTPSSSGSATSMYYVGIGDTVQINYSIASPKTTWTTSDASIIKVNASGMVIGVHEGLAVVYATANDGSSISKWEVKCFKTNVS